MFAILLEHSISKGNGLSGLAHVRQAMVCPVSDKSHSYALKLRETSDRTIQKKVSVRVRDKPDHQVMTVHVLLAHFKDIWLHYISGVFHALARPLIRVDQGQTPLFYGMDYHDLRISPLHTKFHSPLSHSSELVSRAFRQFLAAFTFNPIHHLCALYAQSFRRTLAPPPPRLIAVAATELAEASSLIHVMNCAVDKRALQAALPFFTHAILLDRAFTHCPSELISFKKT
ncbi:hypothetical protein H5410_057202 [Solanum commersonii]|uniref:Uncharacterized protein n=1 Tax=Solanum commersonii TaxID=4109 RepID=A0A9J5WPG1_SOLCO|nr:hypothetical protein H5410_057202 [Solanum commersonii]